MGRRDKLKIKREKKLKCVIDKGELNILELKTSY
jgi:hypothetical protein